MAIDQRDWHRNYKNRRDRYTERAAFRLGHGELQRRKLASAWRRNLVALALVALALLATQLFL